MPYSVNESALEIVDEMISCREDLLCRVAELSNGSTVIDAGVQVAGSTELGRLIGEVSMGGLAAILILIRDRIKIALLRGAILFPSAGVVLMDNNNHVDPISRISRHKKT